MRFPWGPLDQAGLWGTGVVIRRSEIAFLKHVVESYEGLGFTRMVCAQGDHDALVAVLGPASSCSSLDRLLDSLRSSSGDPLVPQSLPEVCHQRWFLQEWS